MQAWVSNEAIEHDTVLRHKIEFRAPAWAYPRPYLTSSVETRTSNPKFLSRIAYEAALREPWPGLDI